MGSYTRIHDDMKLDTLQIICITVVRRVREREKREERREEKRREGLTYLVRRERVEHVGS